MTENEKKELYKEVMEESEKIYIGALISAKLASYANENEAAEDLEMNGIDGEG